MKKIGRFFSTAFSYLLYKWLMVIIDLIKKIFRARAVNKKEKEDIPRRIRKALKGDCVPIRHPNYHRPDPMIYSQFYLMKQGLAVTWDNPDIQLYQNGFTVPSHALQPDTEYELVARCWNLSYDAPVVGMPVRFTYLEAKIEESLNMPDLRDKEGKNPLIGSSYHPLIDGCQPEERNPDFNHQWLRRDIITYPAGTNASPLSVMIRYNKPTLVLSLFLILTTNTLN